MIYFFQKKSFLCPIVAHLCPTFAPDFNLIILTPKTMKRKTNVFNTLKDLVILTADSGDIMPEEVEPIAEKARGQLGLETPMQAILLSAFADMYEAESVTPSNLAKHFDVKPIMILSVLHELDFFVNRGILFKYKNDHGHMAFKLASDVLDALQEGYLLEPDKKDNLTIESLLQEIFSWVEVSPCERMSEEQFFPFIRSLFSKNKHLSLAKRLAELNLDNDSLHIFFIMLKERIVDNELSVTGNDIYHYMHITLFDRKPILRRLRSDANPLIVNHLIEAVCDNGQISDNEWTLTDECIADLLGEIDLTEKTCSRKGLILAEQIEPKSLFFSEDVRRQVDKLRKVLDKERMGNVLASLEKHQMRKCFTCIFHGAPGTGKTETVKQLARQTGRDIMLVDIPSIRSKWVGDSEKNIKAIFTRYKKLANGRNDAPILLFNEADALLTCRNTSSSGSVDKMENAMQDIILQEMESLEGIMIATTNITSNLDKAFERRFLYKVEFEKPPVEARKAIWQSMIPELSEEMSDSLARKYDFSGGEIENVARKYLIGNIIDCDETDEGSIFDLCERERFNLKERNSVGFNVK